MCTAATRTFLNRGRTSSASSNTVGGCWSLVHGCSLGGGEGGGGGGDPPASLTVTVPVMPWDSWNWQTNVYVPGVSKRYAYGLVSPTPVQFVLLDLTLWNPSHVHVTLSPAVIVTAGGVHVRSGEAAVTVAPCA